MVYPIISNGKTIFISEVILADFEPSPADMDEIGKVLNAMMNKVVNDIVYDKVRLNNV